MCFNVILLPKLKQFSENTLEVVFFGQFVDALGAIGT